MTDDIDRNDIPAVTPDMARKKGIMVECSNARCGVEILRDNTRCPICGVKQPERA